jgi:hypothetical protein
MKNTTHRLFFVFAALYCWMSVPCIAEEDNVLKEYRYNFEALPDGKVIANIIGIEVSYTDVTAPVGGRGGSFKFSLNPPEAPIFRGKSGAVNRPGLMVFEYRETMFIVYGSKFFAVSKDGILKTEGKSYNPETAGSVTLTPVEQIKGVSIGGRIGSE